MPSLDLFLHERFVGVVTPDGRNQHRVVLNIDSGYQDGGVLLSEAFAALPGHRPPAVAVSNFLGGYVPEGRHREQMAAKRRIDKDNLFALLNEFGGSVAGAATLHSDDESTTTPSYEPLSDQALDNKLRQAISDSDQGIPDDSRSTLPGYQPKVLVVQIDGQWAYPHGRAHSTHILKPQVPARPCRLFDEHYSHLLSQRIGLSQYRSAIMRAGRTTYLAVERFDRQLVGGEVRLLHQEDLAQALGLDWRNPDAKFQEPEWPSDPGRASAQRIGRLLGAIPGHGEAVEQWLRHLTFHIAIGNNDAHAKNIALMHQTTGTELSQMYDAVPNLFQEGLINWNLALAVDGLFDHRRISVEHIVAEARSWGAISATRAETAITDTLVALDAAITSIEPPADISPRLVQHLQWNTRRLLSGAEIGEPKR